MYPKSDIFLKKEKLCNDRICIESFQIWLKYMIWNVNDEYLFSFLKPFSMLRINSSIQWWRSTTVRVKLKCNSSIGWNWTVPKEFSDFITLSSSFCSVLIESVFGPVERWNQISIKNDSITWRGYLKNASLAHNGHRRKWPNCLVHVETSEFFHHVQWNLLLFLCYYHSIFRMDSAICCKIWPKWIIWYQSRLCQRTFL